MSISERLLADIETIHFRTFRHPAGADDMDYDEAMSICQKIEDREMALFTEIAAEVRKLRSQRKLLKLLYVYDSKIVGLEDELDRRHGALTVKSSLTGNEMISARIGRINRLNEMCVELQDELRNDIKLVGDEDRKIFAKRGLIWGVGVGLGSLVVSAFSNFSDVFLSMQEASFFCESGETASGERLFAKCDIEPKE